MFDASSGRDGFVSLECTPDVAYDTAATIEQATQLWERLDCPNVMIKVPPPSPDVPAIEQLTAEGVNVNVTLLFSVARYEQVIEAHLTGLKRRMSAGQPLDGITSVASFFVSRVDTKASQVLDDTSPLLNRVAVANAHRAYQRYRARFGDERWAALERLGARPQRPLWASTATKDPNVSDVLYVEQLIARDVINTMPQATLAAFADHGDVADAIGLDARDVDRVLRDASAAGVDLPAITRDLEQEGVRAFCDSYRELHRRQAGRRGLPHPGDGAGGSCMTAATALRRPRRDGYAAIEDYAAIGDGRTVALVAWVDRLAVPARPGLAERLRKPARRRAGWPLRAGAAGSVHRRPALPA